MSHSPHGYLHQLRLSGLLGRNEERQVKPTQSLTAFFPGMTLWKAPGLGDRHAFPLHLLGVLFSLPRAATLALDSTFSHCPLQKVISSFHLYEVTKKEGKKGQALLPAVGEAAFSAADDDSRCPSWRLELGMRPERLVCRGKPQFLCTLACREEHLSPSVRSQHLVVGTQLPLQTARGPAGTGRQTNCKLGRESCKAHLAWYQSGYAGS